MLRFRQILLCLFVVTCDSFAGVHTPDEPCPFEIDGAGLAKPLPFNQFANLLADRLAARVPVDPNLPDTADWAAAGTDGWRATPAGRLTQRLCAAWPNRNALTGTQRTAYSALYIRLLRDGEALEYLQPELRSRTMDYWRVANLVHLHTERGEWDTAITRHENLADIDTVTALPGHTPAQASWVQKINAVPYRVWLKGRQRDTNRRTPAEDLQPELEIVRDYPDAIAVSQQLCLWSPADNRLLWLLGEVYLARRNIREAHAVLTLLREGRSFHGPRKFNTSRKLALDEFSLLPAVSESELSLDPVDTPPEPAAENDDRVWGLVDRPTLIIVGIGFALLTATLLTLQVRSAMRRKRLH